MAGPNVLQEGIYRLQSKGRGFGEVLDLSDGDWKWGQLQTWEPSSEGNNRGTWNQRYLITLVPRDNPNNWYYHVTNLFYGALVGVYNGERDKSWKVKAAPSTTSEWGTQWGFWEVESGRYSIYWRPDNNRRFDVRENNHHGDILAWGNNHQDNQIFGLVRDTNIDHPGKSTAEWMSHVTGNPKLSMLNLVGTHQSLALHAKGAQGREGNEVQGTNIFDNPRCQNRSPYEQMVDGVRVFDCRFDVWTGNDWASNLYAWHGDNSVGAAEGYSLTAVLQSIKLFLKQFNRETIIISMNNETGTGGWESAFRNDFHGYEYLFYENYHPGKQSIHQINLDDVRGKAILLMGGTPFSNPIDRIFNQGTFYSGNGATLHSEDRYDLSFTRWNEKTSACINNIAAAKNDGDETHVYSTSWNMSNLLSFPAPYNPCDFFVYAQSSIVNVLQQTNIGSNGQHRIGIVTFDFYEQLSNETLQIIRSNPGCGNIHRN